MHIAEGYLPWQHALAWGVVATPFVVHGGRVLSREVRRHPESTLLLGASGAFCFVLSALKIPSVTGSSSHPTGTGLGAILFRPPIMAVLGTITLLFQALLLAHGGLTTLGANAFSMAIAGPWAGYGAYVLTRRLLRDQKRGVTSEGGVTALDVSVFVGAFVADLCTYTVTSVQLAMAFPDPDSGFLGALTKFTAIFSVTQIPLAVSEGLLTVLVIRMLRQSNKSGLAEPGAPLGRPDEKGAAQ